MDVVVIGSGGGPLENNLSSCVSRNRLHLSETYTLSLRYLLKASEAKWEDGCISIEAGSGIAALARLVEHNPNLFHDLTPKDDDKNKTLLAARIYSYVQ